MPVVNPPVPKVQEVPSLPPPSEDLYREARLVRITGQPDKVYLLVRQADNSLVWVQVATPEVLPPW